MRGFLTNLLSGAPQPLKGWETLLLLYAGMAGSAYKMEEEYPNIKKYAALLFF